MHRSGWIRLVSFDYIWHNVIVSRSRDGISARCATWRSIHDLKVGTRAYDARVPRRCGWFFSATIICEMKWSDRRHRSLAQVSIWSITGIPREAQDSCSWSVPFGQVNLHTICILIGSITSQRRREDGLLQWVVPYAEGFPRHWNQL